MQVRERKLRGAAAREHLKSVAKAAGKKVVESEKKEGEEGAPEEVVVATVEASPPIGDVLAALENIMDLALHLVSVSFLFSSFFFPAFPRFVKTSSRYFFFFKLSSMVNASKAI